LRQTQSALEVTGRRTDVKADARRADRSPWLAPNPACICRTCKCSYHRCAQIDLFMGCRHKQRASVIDTCNLAQPDGSARSMPSFLQIQRRRHDQRIEHGMVVLFEDLGCMDWKPMSRVRVLACLLALVVVTVVTCLNASSATAAVPKKPVITSLSPRVGSVDGGNVVTITGRRLSGTTQVLFGATAVSDISNVSSTEIRVFAPKHVREDVDIRVTTPHGTSPISSKARYGYQPANNRVSSRDALSTVFNTILHVLLLGSLVAFFCAIVWMAFKPPQSYERILRIAAIFAGAMVAVGARASGADYPTYIVRVMTNVPGAWLTHVALIVVPGLIGVVLGFAITLAMKRNNTMAIRLLGFIGMLATTSFLQIYAEAATLKGFNLGAAALPNIAFSTSVILAVVFTQQRGDAANKPLVWTLVGFLLAKRKNSGVRSAQSRTSSHTTLERDPFISP
jgi:IPT/TIG domain